MPCTQCLAKPQTDDELIVSLAMSDHYFDQAALEAMGEYTKENGHPPRLDPESEKTFRRNFEEVKASGVLDQMLRERDGN